MAAEKRRFLIDCECGTKRKAKIKSIVTTLITNKPCKDCPQEEQDAFMAQAEPDKEVTIATLECLDCGKIHENIEDPEETEKDKGKEINESKPKKDKNVIDVKDL